MHVVLWTVAGERYATRTDQIIEVIPPVEARPVPESPAWVRGLIDYRGLLIPLVDVPCLLNQGIWSLTMASRVIVIATEKGQNGVDHLRALLVQSVLGGEDLDFNGGAEMPSRSSACGEFLGPMILTQSGAVQLTYPDRLTWET
jgi:chemotaxis-related protein WspB